MGLALALLAAGIAKHAMQNAGSISDSAYTAEARKAKMEGLAVVGFTVDETGKTRDCKAIKSSGWPLLDEQTCKFVESFRYKPALDVDGKPVADAFKLGVAWKLPRNLTVYGPEPLAAR